MSSVSHDLSSNHLQSLLTSALTSAGSTINRSQKSADGSGAISDHSQLSPLAEVLSTLQQIQQSDPQQYQQVTQQISTNLQSAAQTAQTDGNSKASSQLTQLATDFTNASQSGQLPNIQDLAQAVGGNQHHFHGLSDGSDNPGPGQSLSQLLSSLRANGPEDNSLNPATIILNTLSNAAPGAATS